MPQAWKKYATPEFVYDYILVDRDQLKNEDIHDDRSACISLTTIQFIQTRLKSRNNDKYHISGLYSFAATATEKVLMYHHKLSFSVRTRQNYNYRVQCFRGDYRIYVAQLEEMTVGTGKFRRGSTADLSTAKTSEPIRRDALAHGTTPCRVSVNSHRLSMDECCHQSRRRVTSLGGRERRVLVRGRRVSVDRIQLLHRSTQQHPIITRTSLRAFLPHAVNCRRFCLRLEDTRTLK